MTWGLDGVYIDQFSLAWSEDGNRYTMDQWDGRTVILDADGRVKEKRGDLGLMSAEARREWVEAGLDRAARWVVCNTLPAVFDVAESAHVPFHWKPRATIPSRERARP